ncbi:Unknown protein, partial [Striga hermonthica]
TAVGYISNGPWPQIECPASRSKSTPMAPGLTRGSPAKAHALTAHNNKRDYPTGTFYSYGDNRSTTVTAHIEGYMFPHAYFDHTN